MSLDDITALISDMRRRGLDQWSQDEVVWFNMGLSVQLSKAQAKQKESAAEILQLVEANRSLKRSLEQARNNRNIQHDHLASSFAPLSRPLAEPPQKRRSPCTGIDDSHDGSASAGNIRETPVGQTAITVSKASSITLRSEATQLAVDKLSNLEKRTESVASVVETIDAASSRKVLVHVCGVPGCSYKSLAKHYNMNRHYKTHPGFTKNFKTVQLTEAEFKFVDKQVQKNKDDLFI